MSSRQARFGSRRIVPPDYDGQLGDGQLVPTVLEEDGGETRCPHCGRWFKQVANHWSQNDCPHPPISQYKMKLCTGMLMGDGCLRRSGRNFSVEFTSTNKSFLNWLTSELGWVSSSVILGQTSADHAKKNTGENWSDNPEDYYDTYIAYTMKHPAFKKLASWYDSGEKVYPVDLTPSPELLKMWYVSDGTIVSC